MVVERSGNLTYPKKLMIYLGFPTEPEKTEARRTNFSRYFRQLDNPEHNRQFSGTGILPVRFHASNGSQISVGHWMFSRPWTLDFGP